MINNDSIVEELVIEIRSFCPDFYVESAWVCDYGMIAEGDNMPLKGTKYYYRIDPPRGVPGPGNQYHFHLIFKKKDVLAINIDGSSHDNWHQVKIPDEVVPFLKRKNFTIPPDQIIESKQCGTVDFQLIVDAILEGAERTVDYLDTFDRILQKAQSVPQIYKFTKDSIYVVKHLLNNNDACYQVKDCSYDDDGNCIRLKIRVALTDNDMVIDDLLFWRMISMPLQLNDFYFLSMGWEIETIEVKSLGVTEVFSSPFMISSFERVYVQKISEGEYRLLKQSDDHISYTPTIGYVNTIDSLTMQVWDHFHVRIPLELNKINHLMLLCSDLQVYVQVIDSIISSSQSSIEMIYLQIYQLNQEKKLNAPIVLCQDDVAKIVKYGIHKGIWKIACLPTGAYIEKIKTD